MHHTHLLTHTLLQTSSNIMPLKTTA